MEQINRNNVVITTEMKIQKPYTYPYKKEGMRNENMSNTATISQELGEMNQKCIELLGQV